MSESPPPPACALPSRPRGWLGPIVLLAWLGCIGWGFWRFEAQPLIARAERASQPERVRAVEAVGRQLGAGRGVALLVQLGERLAACRCASRSASPFELTQLAASRGVRLKRPEAAAGKALDALLPDSAEWLLFAPDGALLYAGPERDEAFCGGASPVLAGLMQLDMASVRTPLPILDTSCPCTGPT